MKIELTHTTTFTTGPITTEDRRTAYYEGDGEHGDPLGLAIDLDPLGTIVSALCIAIDVPSGQPEEAPSL